MSNAIAFGPNFSKTKSINVTTTSASATFDATDVSSTPTPANSGPSGGHSVMRIVNTGTKIAFVRWGVGAQTALTTDMPIYPGWPPAYMTKAGADDTLAAICGGSDSTTLYITCGEGMPSG
jgi:hypothetical protein